MSKTRLPPQLSWPLRTQDLQLALSADWSSVRVVRMIRGNNGSESPLTISWSPHELEGGLSLWMFAVRKDELENIRHALTLEALPDLAAWVQRAFSAGSAWQLSRHERRWHWPTKHCGQSTMTACTS